MSNVNVVAILGFGTVGLIFLLALLIASLLKTISASVRPKLVYGFMALVLCLSLVSAVLQYAMNGSELAECRSKYDEIIESHTKLNGVVGTIVSPVEGALVTRTFNVSGTSSALAPGMHLRLAVEVDGALWPRGEPVNRSEDGKWTATVFQDSDGGSGQNSFDLDLLVTDEVADSKIDRWAQDGRQSRFGYQKMEWQEGIVRLSRIKLFLKPDHG